MIYRISPAVRDALIRLFEKVDTPATSQFLTDKRDGPALLKMRETLIKGRKLDGTAEDR